MLPGIAVALGAVLMLKLLLLPLQVRVLWAGCSGAVGPYTAASGVLDVPNVLDVSVGADVP